MNMPVPFRFVILCGGDWLVVVPFFARGIAVLFPVAP